MPAAPDRDSVDMGDSFERWHQVTCRNYSLAESKRASDGPFGARISIEDFGPLALTDTSSSVGATQLMRGPAEIRLDPRDHFMLYLVTEGEIGVTQGGREARARTGDFFLYDQARPFTLEFQQHYHSIILSIPRPLLEARVPRAHAHTAHRIAGTSKLGTLTGTIIRQLVGFSDRTDSNVVERVAASALDIVATALDAETVGEGLPRTHRLLNRVETHILANLHDPRLNIETIASALNMTPRTLNRVFALEGTTPMRWLWQQRLAASYRALSYGYAKNVTDAALNFGFSDVSHFSRVFKMTFGKPPNQLKRR